MMKRIAIPAFLAALGLFAGCGGVEIRHEAYPDGARKAQSAFLTLADDAKVRHGVQMSWYPDGGRQSMEIYVNGYRQGYAFRWHPDGKMKSLEHFTDGMRDGQARFWDSEGRLVACLTRDGADCLRPSAGDPDPSALAARP